MKLFDVWRVVEVLYHWVANVVKRGKDDLCHLWLVQGCYVVLPGYKRVGQYSHTPCYVALPGCRGLEGARLISLRLENYIRGTGVGTCVEFKIIIRLCLVIKGWTKYSWRVDKGFHLRIMDSYV